MCTAPNLMPPGWVVGGRYTVLAEEDDGTLAGFVCAFGAKDAKHGTLVDNLHVAGSAEGKSVGRRLMAAAALWSEREFPEVGFWLHAIEGNKRACRFYEHIGGVHTGVSVQETAGGPVRAVLYTWPSIDSLRPFQPLL